MNNDSPVGGGVVSDGPREENPPAGNMPEVGKTDFDFYAKFTKPLILTLGSTDDRILAASWFSKIKDVGSGPDQLRLDYLKLLLFVLQRHRLAGPFTTNPNAQDKLEEFGEDYQLAAVARQIIEKDQEERKENHNKKMRGEVGDWPPYSTDYSADLKEYVAAQDIPNFGVHVYYALSKDPILDWDNSELANIPRGVKRMEPQGRISDTSFAVIEPKPETPDEVDRCKIFEETGVMPEEGTFVSRKARERKSPYRDIDRPAPPLGVLPGGDEEDFFAQEVPPPTWGSNLIEVREPIDMEGPGTPSEATSPRGERSMVNVAEPEDPEILDLLDKSFNMEDILAEVDAMEIEDPPADEDEIDPLIIEEQMKFREIEAELDRHDAAIAEALADLDEDEKRMLMEMEAEEAAGLKPKPKTTPKKEVKLIADDDTVMKVLVEAPEAAVESKEEQQRRAAKEAEEKKKKPPGRTGLNKSKVKGALLKPGEKKEIEEQEKNAKVVETRTGIPSKRPGIPKLKTSKVQVSTAASEGDIPSEQPSVVGKGKGIPGKGIPRKGIPRRVAKPAEGSAEMNEMKERLDQKLQETKEAYPEKFQEEEMAAGPSGLQAPVEQTPARARTPVDEMTNYLSQGSPESDDIYNEMDREYEILERLYQLYEKLAPNRPDVLRTPPMFSKHPEIRELGRQLRYRPDEFQVHPLEKFQPGAEYFRGEGAPSPFVDPREARRLGVTGAAPGPESAQEMPSRFSESPWGNVEDLKKIVDKAEKSMNASPAIAGGIGTTTPKSPSTPRRPARKDLLSVFEMESPPEFGSPPDMPTPEFLHDPAYILPEVMTQAKLDEMFAEKQAEYDAFIQAEAEAEKALWPVLQPKPPTPPPPPPLPPPPRVSPRAPGQASTTPQQRASPRAQTPPSVGGPGTIPVTPGTPQGFPPLQFITPPDYRIPEQVFEIPQPMFEEFDPMEIKELRFQQMPDLVESDLDEYESPAGSPDFEGLHDWRDPLDLLLEAQEEPYMIFDMSDDMVAEEDLVPAEEDYAQYSPAITLQDRLMQHEIPQEFYDPSRPGAKSRQVRIGHRKVQVGRKSQPSELTRNVIEEDLTGEELQEYKDMYEEMIQQEEQDFLNRSIGDPDRTEYIAKMAQEAQDMPALFDEELPEGFEMKGDISIEEPSPEKPYYGPPTPVLVVPPYGAVDMERIYEGVPEDQFKGIFIDEEPDFLASPGLPSPEPSPPPPPPPESPPFAPPFESYLVDDIYEDLDMGFLASPGMPEGRTVEDELREIGLMSPIRSPPRQPSPVRQPSPPRQPQVQVEGAGGMPIVIPERTAAPPYPVRMRQTPPRSPELDPDSFRREMMRHRVNFKKKEQFKAGQRKVQRRAPMARPYFPIREHAGFEESKKLHTEMDDYRELMSRLPPMPPPAPYPEDLMGVEREGRFEYRPSLLDQPLSPTEGLPSPLAPKRGFFGWQTPPHMRAAPSDLRYRPSPPSPPPLQRDQMMAMRAGARVGLVYPLEDEDIMGMREEDIFPEELLESPGSPRVPASLMVTPPQPPPPLAIPTMTMNQQMMQAQQRAQWQAQQIAERSQQRPSPPLRQSPRRPQPSPPHVKTCAEIPSSPRLLKRVQDASFSSGVYDPENPENSKRYTKGMTTLEFNRDEEEPRQGVDLYPQGPPISTRVSPAPMPMSQPMQMPQPMPMPEPMLTPQAAPQQRRARIPRVPRPQVAGATPRAQVGRTRRISREEAMPVRRRLFEGGSPSEVPQPREGGTRVQIVEEFEETEHDYIPEHLLGYKWMDNPEEDEFYSTFKQQFQ